MLKDKKYKCFACNHGLKNRSLIVKTGAQTCRPSPCNTENAGHDVDIALGW